MIKSVKLSALCKMQSGGTPSRSNLDYYDGDFPWAKISDLEKSDDGYIYKTEEHITQEALHSINNRQFQPGTLLLAMYGSVGKTAITKIHLTTNQAILGINILDDSVLDIKYLKYWFSTIKERLLNRAVGAALPNISLGIVKDLEIPLPPLPQQQKIANILDAADALRQNDKALIAKYDELTQALFLDMFGDPRMNINRFTCKIMDEVASKITDGDHLTPKREETGYKLLSCRNIKNGYIDFSPGVDYVGESEFKRMFKRCNPEKGDILISCSGTIGRTTSIKIEEPFVLVRSAALIKPKKDIINPLYLEFYLRTEFMQSIMKKSSNTSSQANLFTGPIKKLPVLMPELNLQNQFAERVAVIEEQKAIAQKQLEKSEELFNSLLQKAFKGELV